MALFDFFLHGLVTNHIQSDEETKRRLAESRRLKNRYAARRRAAGVSKAKPSERIEALEEDVGFLSLMLMGILESLTEKGMVTREDVLATMQSLDGFDGAVDGKLNVQVLRSLRDADTEPAPEDESAS